MGAGGRFEAREMPLYVVAQVLGAIVAAFLLFYIASGSPVYDLATNGLAANGFGEGSPGGYDIWSGDRKGVVEGESVSVRVDLGGRRIIKKKKEATIKRKCVTMTHG